MTTRPKASAQPLPRPVSHASSKLQIRKRPAPNLLQTFRQAAILSLFLFYPQISQSSNWVIHERHGGLEIFSEARIATDSVVSELAEVQREIRDLLQLKSDGLTVQIVVFRSFDSYRSYLANRIPEAVHRRAIFYRSGAVSQLYAVYHKEMMTDLRHEYTHAVLHHALPYVPLWIDEGTAEYLEVPASQRHRSSRLTATRWKSRTGWSPDLKTLESIRSAGSMTNEDYRDSWAWIHFLLESSNSSKDLLRSYLAAVSAGEAAGQFSEWVENKAPRLPREIGSYFRRFRFSLRSPTP